MTLEEDWERVQRVWKTCKERFWDPSLFIYAHITALRRIDKGIAHPIVRLLESGKYIGRLQVTGAPPHGTAKYPIKYNKKHYTYVRVRCD